VRFFSFAPFAAPWLIGGVLSGCGAPSSAAPVARPAPENRAASTASPPPSPPSPPSAGKVAPAAAKPHPDDAAIFARIKPELTLCYERGRKAVPTMLDGKLTLNASIDADGKTTCVIPTEDKGLTQEVEDCMSAGFAKERFDPGAAWTASVPVAVRGGSVELGAPNTASAEIDSVETHRMADAFETLEALVPELQACVRDVDRSAGLRSVTAGARVGLDGRTQCALASGSPVELPPKATQCTEGVFRQARFPAPKGGPGLILVPIRVMRGK
jgi:hypothetical protein